MTRPRCRNLFDELLLEMGTSSLIFSLVFEIKLLHMLHMKTFSFTPLSSNFLRQPLMRPRVSATSHRSRTLMMMMMKQARTRGSMVQIVIVKLPPSTSLTKNKRTMTRTPGMPKLQQALQPWTRQTPLTRKTTLDLTSTPETPT